MALRSILWEYILRDATGPEGKYHGGVGKNLSTILDYPFLTGRSTPDSALVGELVRKVLEEGSAPLRLVNKQLKGALVGAPVLSLTSLAIMKGHEAILRQFLANDLDHMFGNPGTVEQGFLDALADVPEMKYILTLQESIAVLCADGYARARLKPALVQIHSSPGLGNAIGNLYQAMRGQAPLVVIGGDAGIKYQAMDGQMAADLTSLWQNLLPNGLPWFNTRPACCGW